MANHGPAGQRSLEDVIGIVGHQLLTLGHKVVWDPKNEQMYHSDRGYNIIVEGFTPAIVEVIAKMHGQGARFICLATEEPTDKGFNHGTSKEMTMRQETFCLAAPYLDGILHLVPGQNVTDWYAQWAPTAYIELGYAPSLVRKHDPARAATLNLTPAPEPEFEFGFFGTISKRRRAMLRKLAHMTPARNAINIVQDMCSQEERDAQMQRCKVILQIRKFDEMGLVSSSRCNTALCLGRPVLAEPHELSKPWDEIVKFAKTEDDFYTQALFLRNYWRGEHRAQMERFKAKLPPSLLAKALDDIGITRKQKAA